MPGTRGSIRRGPRPRDAGARTLDRIFLSLSERLSDSLEREMIDAAALGPRWTASVILAAVVAALLYGAALGLIAVGIVVAVGGWPHIGLLVVAGALIAAGAVICPRPIRRSRLGHAPAPDPLPCLDAVLGEIASALGVAPPDRVVFDLAFNGSWRHDGWRRRRVLTLGVPLIAALDAESTLALLAHELAHERNGDARRGLLIGSSLDSLTTALDLLTSRGWRGSWGLAGLSLLLTDALLWACRQPLRGLLALQAHLLFRASQRAEYLADDRAASVAGADAVIALHDTLLARPAVQTAIRRVTLAGDRSNSAVIDAIRDATSPADPTRRAERRARARRQRARLAATHPTTASRIEVLERRPHRPASVTLDAAVAVGLRRELRAAITGRVGVLLEQDLDLLHRGR